MRQFFALHAECSHDRCLVSALSFVSRGLWVVSPAVISSVGLSLEWLSTVGREWSWCLSGVGQGTRSFPFFGYSVALLSMVVATSFDMVTVIGSRVNLLF